MTLIEGHSRLRKERSSISLPDYFPILKLDNNMSDQLAEPPRANLLVAVVPSVALPVPKYIKEDLQRIFKIVLEA